MKRSRVGAITAVALGVAFAMGLAFAADAQQYALEFDGSSSRVEIPNVYEDQGEISVSAWAYVPSGAGGRQTLFWNGGGWSREGIYFEIEGGGRQVIFQMGDGDEETRSGGGSVPEDEWAYITGQWQNGDLEMWINGELVHTAGWDPGYHHNPNFNAYIGVARDGDGNLGRFYEGRIAGVSIFNRALSESEIQANMSQGLTGDEAGLMGYFPLVTGTGATANDLSPRGNNGTIVDAQWVEDANVPVEEDPVPVPYVLDFSGDSNSFVESGLSPEELGLDGNAPRTIEAWAYTRAFNNGGVFSMGTRSDGQDFSHRTMTSTNDWRVQFWGGAYDFDFNYPTENEWVHFALVHTGDESFLYANGEVVGSGDQEINTGNNFTFRAGSWHDTDFFNGMIADLRVWDHARSASLINRDMNQRLRGSENGLILYWPMNEGDGDPGDLSPNNRDGAIEGNVEWVQAPDLPVEDIPDAPPIPVELTRAAALDLDGNGQHVVADVDAGDLGIAGNAPKTMEAWAYTRLWDDNGGLVNMGAPGTAGEDFSLRVLGSENAWRAQLWGGADIDFDYPSHEQWVHFAVVHTGSETIIFANGELVASQEQEINTSAAQPFRVGWWPHRGESDTFDGMVTEVRVWDYARPQSAIMADMYQRLTGAEDGLLIHWPLDDPGADMAYDTSPNQHHGTIVGDPEWATEEMPDVSGLHWEEAATILEEAGFRLHLEYVGLGVVPTAHVHAQAPGGGQTSAPYWTVVLQIEAEPQSFAPAAPAWLMLLVMVSLLSLAGLRMRKGLWVS